MLRGKENEITDCIFDVCTFTKMVWDHFQTILAFEDYVISVEKFWVSWRKTINGKEIKMAVDYSLVTALFVRLYGKRGTKGNIMWEISS